MNTDQHLEPEDILSDSLESIYDLKPITVGSFGSTFTYQFDGVDGSEQYRPTTIAIRTPDTLAANWALHASAIWISSLYLADHISQLDLPSHARNAKSPPLRVLELGASAGLPSILIAKLFPDISVTVSDYPDDELMKALSNNVNYNKVTGNCRVVPYAWGTDPQILPENPSGFDIVLAADTIWNPDLHAIFVDALKKTLRPSPSSRIHLVAGLHTGRYTINTLLNRLPPSGFDIESAVEHEVGGSTSRQWTVLRDGEDDGERRRWVVWIQLKWQAHLLGSESHGKEQ